MLDKVAYLWYISLHKAVGYVVHKPGSGQMAILAVKHGTTVA